MTIPLLLLVLRGLDWPAQALHDLTFDLPTPGLDALHADALIRVEPAPDVAGSDVASAALWPRRHGAVAASRRLGYGAHADDGHWLCLDPVRLAFGDRSVRLHPLPESALAADEGAALGVDLAAALAALGQFELTTPARWHLRLAPHVSAPILAAPMAGADPSALLALDAAWRGALTDVQMLLHTHPVNAARRATGAPEVNALWPWGAGRLAPAAAATPWHVFTDEPALRGHARHHGATVAPVPAHLNALPAGAPCLVVLDALDGPAAAQDATAWRHALAAFDADWFGPAHAALQSGAIGGIDIAITASDRLTRIAPRRAGPLRQTWRRLARRPLPHAFERWSNP